MKKLSWPKQDSSPRHSPRQQNQNQNQNSLSQNRRIIKDCIYGHIEMPEICAAFMDVPEFQRLRRIKQLGSASRVYPSATHTRFEHCIGTMHLAGQFATHLNIDGRPRELIQLAGLYHDVGHLPYSHLFDRVLGTIYARNKLNEIRENSNDHNENKDRDKDKKHKSDKTSKPKIKLPPLHHEDRSLEIFTSVARRLNLLTSAEEQFVRACIVGSYNTIDPQKYMYQIVSSSIDVDKLDYLRRDAYHCGMPIIQSDYIILCARIDQSGNIAFRENAKGDIINMFDTRQRMHELVYQHPVALKYDTMYACMILRAFDAGAITSFDTLCDYQLETILMNCDATSNIYTMIESRQLDHDMICGDKAHRITKNIPDSGNVEDIKFIK